MQGELYREPTRYLLEQARIGPGMRVLDAGCGVGDVTIELAKLVGSAGAVIGVDADADALAMAEQRLKALGLLNVTFMHAVLPDVALDEPVDAVAGRLIVVHLDDPVQTIRSLSELVRPGGVVTLQDVNNSGATSTPTIPLYRWSIALMRDALKAAGRDPDTGSALPEIFKSAGLPNPAMGCVSPVTCDPDSVLFEVASDFIASLLPVIEKHGLATHQQIDLDTLAERMRAEVRTARAVVFAPQMVAVWARIGKSSTSAMVG
jgi:ubiquinone/menaquinone biosynthesis C-methylase UbiE